MSKRGDFVLNLAMTFCIAWILIAGGFLIWWWWL